MQLIDFVDSFAGVNAAGKRVGFTAFFADTDLVLGGQIGDFVFEMLADYIEDLMCGIEDET